MLRSKNLLFVLSHFLALNLSAQMCPCEFGQSGKDKPLRLEIGINGLNYQEELFNFYNPLPVYHQNFLNGLMLKYHFNKLSLRAGFDYSANSYSYVAETASDYNKNDGNRFRKDLRAGIEKSLYTGKIQVYAAADLLLSRGNFSGISAGRGDQTAEYHLPYRFKSNAIGVSPGLGIKYRPLKRFSISMEASLSILHYRTYSKDGVYQNESGGSLLFNPLRVLSLNYHF